MKRFQALFTLGALLTSLSLALTACGGTVAPAAPESESRPEQASTSTDADQGPVAANFTVSTGDDSTFSLNEHRGEIVVLYFSFPG